ncbi:MAG: hypothetical protein V1678_05460 [Candidatus Aenigmatarchaeota archaeon]
MKVNKVNFNEFTKIFDIKNESMSKGAWWWWFCLFFIDDKNNPNTPKQLMVLWSTKNSKSFWCNDIKMEMCKPSSNDTIPGAVASWYFDGQKMQQPLLFEQCNLKLSSNILVSDSSTPTSFSMEGGKGVVKIGDDFELNVEVENNHDFTKPLYASHSYLFNKGYSMIRLIHLKLTGKIKGENISGSAFFHRIFVNLPSPSWHWGLFHFKNGGILTYYNPYIFKKSMKKDITLFDGNCIHEFVDIKVKKKDECFPVFHVSGENDCEKIEFTVKTYSQASWTFKKRSIGFIPNKLVYNEYPSFISDLKLVDKKTGKNINLDYLGSSVGNTEYTTGMLF